MGGVPGSGTPPGGVPGSGTPPGGVPGSGTPPGGVPGSGPPRGVPGSGTPPRGGPGSGTPPRGVPGSGTPGGVPGSGTPWGDPGQVPPRGGPGTPPGGVPGSGTPPRGGTQVRYPPRGGYPGRTTEGVLTTRRAVCLLRSRRRTCLFDLQFLQQDIPLFEGIISDLFPGVVLPKPDYGALETEINKHANNLNLQAIPWFVEKIIQVRM